MWLLSIVLGSPCLSVLLSLRPFALNDLDDYEKHFTVMNYDPDVVLKQVGPGEAQEQVQVLAITVRFPVLPGSPSHGAREHPVLTMESQGSPAPRRVVGMRSLWGCCHTTGLNTTRLTSGQQCIRDRRVHAPVLTLHMGWKGELDC